MAENSRAETDLIARYVRAVGRNLPAKIRGGAEADLLASLRERVGDRLAMAAAGEPAPRAEDAGDREAVEIALLKELGPPEDMARSYLPRGSYLIGPELHGGFVAALKICLGLLTVLFVLGLGSNFGSLTGGAGSLVGMLGQAVSQFLEMALKVFAVIVLIFAAIERAAMPGPAKARRPSPEVATGAARGAVAATAKAPAPAPEWKPESMPEADDRETLWRGHAAFLLALALLALVVLNLIPEWPAAWMAIDGHSGFVPLLGPGWARWLWLLNINLAIAVVRNVLLLRAGRWSLTTRLLDLVGGLVGLAWIYHLAQETEVLKASAEWMIAQGWPTEAAERWTRLIESPISQVVQLGLWLGVVGSVVGVVADVRRLVRTALGR